MVVVKASAVKRLPPKIYAAVKELYDRAINYGAHPNVDGILLSLEIHENENSTEFRTVYLHNDADKIRPLLKDSARIAVACLHMLGKVYEDRFTRLNLWDDLANLSEGL